MTPEQKVAFVFAQVALLNTDVASMQAANTYRQNRGETIAYGDDEMWAVTQKYRSILEAETLKAFFRSAL